MTTREEKILSIDFFSDKQDIAQQIIEFEKAGKGFLPNSFAFKSIPKDAFGNTEQGVCLYKIHTYYVYGLEINEGEWKHKVFENDIKMIQFIADSLQNGDESADKSAESEQNRQLAFWKSQIERLN